MPARPIVVVAAFVVGLSAAAAVYGLRAWSAGGTASVMIDRQAATRDVRPPQPTAGDAVVAVGAPALVRVTVVSPGARSAISENVEPQSQVRRPFDRVLALADALDTCSRERYFERLACEARARASYCDGAAASIPQCAQAADRE